MPTFSLTLPAFERDIDNFVPKPDRDQVTVTLEYRKHVTYATKDLCADYFWDFFMDTFGTETLLAPGATRSFSHKTCTAPAIGTRYFSP